MSFYSSSCFLWPFAFNVQPVNSMFFYVSRLKIKPSKNSVRNVHFKKLTSASWLCQ